MAVGTAVFNKQREQTAFCPIIILNLANIHTNYSGCSHPVGGADYRGRR